MKAEAILKRIDENSKDLSSEVLNEARLKVIKMQNDSRQKIDNLLKDAKLLAKNQANELRKQMQSLSELEFKKQILAEKRVLIEETFKQANLKLKNMPMEDVRQKVTAMIIAQADGGNTISIGEYVSEWFNNDVFEKINQELEKANKKPLIKSDVIEKNCTGAVLSLGGIETNCTLEAILEYIRSDIENDVAYKLFQM